MAGDSVTTASRASWTELLAVLALMTGLSVALTWPLAADLSTALADWGDPLLNAYLLWWGQHALFTPGLSFFDAPFFFPEPLTLAYSEHLLVSSLSVAPLFWLGASPLLAHNLLLLATFALSGLFAYLLGRELTGSRSAAWLVGLGYAFSSFRFGHLGHVQLLTAHFLPLVFLYLHRWRKAPHWGLCAAWGLFWAAQILSCGYLGMFASLGVGLFVLFFGLKEAWWRSARRLGQVAAVLVGVALLVAPFFLPYATVKENRGFARPLKVAADYAARPRSYLGAPPDNLLYGRATAGLRTEEGELFLGLGLGALVLVGFLPLGGPAVTARARRLAAGCVLLALAALIFWAFLHLTGGGETRILGLRLSARSPRPSLWVLGLSLLAWRVFRLGGPRAALAAGPLRFLGLKPAGGTRAWRLSADQAFYLVLAGFGFWLSLGPAYGLYTVFYHLLPGFDAMRVPSRAAVLVSLGLAVLAGFGGRKLVASLEPRPWLGRAAVLVLGLWILAEMLCLPAKWSHFYREPWPVYQWLAAQPGPMVVWEWPTWGYRGDEARDARYLYWQSVHHKTLLNGYSGFFPPGYKEFARESEKMPDPAVVAKARERGAEYLVVHFKEMPQPERADFLKDLKQNPELEMLYHDRWDYVLRLRPPAGASPPADRPANPAN